VIILEQKLNRKIPVPLYYQLKEIIKEEIEEGKLKPGDPIPSERELSEKYGISRPTVRQALKELVYEGWLTREKGRGTFISKPKIDYGFIQHFTTFYDDMVEKGYSLRTVILNKEIRKAGKEIARFLQIGEDEEIIFIDRLRFIEDEPIVRVNNHIPLALCPALVEEDLTDQSLYRIMAEKYGLKPHRAEISLEPIVANEVDSELLDIEKGAPMLLMENVTFTEEGQIIDFFRSRFRGDKGKVRVNVYKER